MTREDAIYWLGVLKTHSEKRDAQNITEALNMAIEALQTENSSEKPNNCEDCIWTVCNYNKAFKDEPTISKMEQVEDEPMKTTDYCDICKRDMCEYCIADATNPYCVPSHYEINYEPKDEPQFDKDINVRSKDEPQTDYGDFADRLAYERGIKHAWEVAQKVFDSTVTFYEAEDVARQTADIPQTDCPWK